MLEPEPGLPGAGSCGVKFFSTPGLVIEKKNTWGSPTWLLKIFSSCSQIVFHASFSYSYLILALMEPKHGAKQKKDPF